MAFIILLFISKGLIGWLRILGADAVDVLRSDEEQSAVCRRGGWVIAVPKIIDGEDAKFGARLNNIAFSGVCKEQVSLGICNGAGPCG